MTSAFDLLLKFVINLLKPNRPPVWRSIKTDNTAFRARVACMKGHKDILRQMGYTESEQNSLQFPEYVLEPDKPKLYIIAAELLMAKLEVEQLSQQQPSQGATHLSSYGYTKQMSSNASSNREEQRPKFQNYALGSQHFSAQLQTTGTVGASLANQQRQQEEIHHYDQTSSASGGNQVGYQTQYQSYREQHNFGIQQYTNVPSTSPVDYHRYGGYVVCACVGVGMWVYNNVCVLNIEGVSHSLYYNPYVCRHAAIILLLLCRGVSPLLCAHTCI